MFGVIGYHLWRKRRGYRQTDRKIAGVVRVAAYTLSVGAVVGVLSLRSAMADVGKASEALGRELMPLSDLINETNEVKVNGESIFIGSAATDQSVSEVMDRFEQDCHQHRAASGEAWAAVDDLRERWKKVPEASLNKASEPEKFKAAVGRIIGMPIDRFGTIRTSHDDDGGVIMCFVQADGTPTDTKAAWQELKNSGGDLGKLGALHYAYVKRMDGGQTHVLTAWTKGKFDISHIAVKSGDAPGTDSTIAPRPPGSRRLISASVGDMPYAIRMYESKAVPAEILAFYDKKMTDDGWITINPLGVDRETKRGYQKGAVQIIVSTERAEGSTQVVLGEVGG